MLDMCDWLVGGAEEDLLTVWCGILGQVCVSRRERERERERAGCN